MLRSFFPFLTATFLASGAFAQEVLPVYGAWDCEIMNFTLDAKIYNVSGKVIAVETVEKIADDAYGATLQDGYRFAMFDVKAKSLTWHSPASGDTFECHRE